MNLRSVARDVFIVLGLTFVGGIVIGLAVGKPVATEPRAQLAVAVSNLLFSIIGYCIAGTLTRTDRFTHLSVVAVFCWLLSTLNMLVMPSFTFHAWEMSILVDFLAMGIGGGLSLLFAPAPKKT